MWILTWFIYFHVWFSPASIDHWRVFITYMWFFPSKWFLSTFNMIHLFSRDSFIRCAFFHVDLKGRIRLFPRLVYFDIRFWTWFIYFNVISFPNDSFWPDSFDSFILTEMLIVFARLVHFQMIRVFYWSLYSHGVTCLRDLSVRGFYMNLIRRS